MNLLDEFGRRKDTFDALQKLIVSVALLVGGSWTLFTFHKLNQVEQSRQTLQESIRRNREQGVLELAIETSVAGKAGAGERILRDRGA
jgi:hypothetical protein